MPTPRYQTQNDEGIFRGCWYFCKSSFEPRDSTDRSKAKMTVVPNIIDEIDFIETQEFSTKSFWLVMWFFHQASGHYTQCISQLPSSQCELHFWRGPDLEKLQALTKHDLNITVHGRITNETVLHSLPNHHAHVQFSTYETFGIATLEARKAGLWAISQTFFGSSAYADEGVLWAENEEELIKSMQDSRTRKPDINPFEGLMQPELAFKFKNATMQYCSYFSTNLDFHKNSNCKTFTSICWT